MRLLNAATQEFTDFPAADQTPPYAILSHTWGLEEVTYEDMCLLPAADRSRKRGYGKVDRFCQQAARAGIEWVWVDTYVAARRQVCGENIGD